jgi:hypothetical protein
MKTYSTLITVLAILAIGSAGYFYWQGGAMRQEITDLRTTNEGLGKDKDLLTQQLTDLKSAVAPLRLSAAALKLVVNSFMYAGDIKAQAIGSKEAAGVETAIGNLTDSADRMSAEKDWKDFKTSLRFNPLFGVIRNLANNIDRGFSNMEGPANPSERLDPLR